MRLSKRGMVEEACLLNVLKSEAVHRFFVLDQRKRSRFRSLPIRHVSPLLVDVLIEGQRAVSVLGGQCLNRTPQTGG